jgi:hypothetical protein
MEPTVRRRSATDTWPDWGGLHEVRRARTVRRCLLVVFGLVLALGATGFLGVRKGTVRAEAGGYDLAVTYPKVTRPGHAVPFAIEVRKSTPFGATPLTLRVSSRYFALFDENGVLPAPSKETATDTYLLWEFDPPPGDVFRVYFDTRTGPNRQRGTSGDVAVLVDDQPVVSVRLTTRVIP